MDQTIFSIFLASSVFVAAAAEKKELWQELFSIVLLRVTQNIENGNIDLNIEITLTQKKQGCFTNVLKQVPLVKTPQLLSNLVRSHCTSKTRTQKKAVLLYICTEASSFLAKQSSFLRCLRFCISMVSHSMLPSFSRMFT